MMKKSILFLLVGLLSNGWLFANHWTPDDAQYEDNMTLTGVISVNGVEQQSTSLEVGVFCGEECRGSGLPTYFFPTQRYVVQLTIFGEVGDQLTFKLYDHALGQELDLVMGDMLAFAANGYGWLQEPFVLDFTGSVVETYTISVSTNPAEGGSVVGGGTYTEGETCTLVATANEGYAFLNWTENGTEISGNATYSFEVTSSRNLVANFVSSGSGAHWIPNEEAYEDNMTLTGVIQINGVEQRSTTLEVGVFCGGECRGSGMPTYFFPTQRYVVQLTIFGEVGDQLTFKLYDHALGQELDLVMGDAVTFTANGYGSLQEPFVLNFTGSVVETYTISVSTNPAEGGSVAGGGTYTEGETCTLVATANEGYAFLNWTENGTEISGNATYSFAVTSSRNLVANFVSSDAGAHWIPNEEAYEDNTTLTGVIQINGVEQQSTTLEVGVFCGGECRGSSMPTYFFPTQRYVVQLTIFGENGDQLTFKLYDHALGQELNLASPDAVTFTSNGYGSLGAPYVLNFTGEEPSGFHFVTAGNWSQASNWQGGTLPGTNDAVFIDASCQLNQNASVGELTVTSGGSLTILSGKILTVSGALTNTAASGLVIEDGAQLVHNTANVQATVRKHIAPFNGSGNGWHLIALPLSGNEAVGSVGHLLDDEYDLYAYDEPTMYWINRKYDVNGFIALESTKGYLYANSDEVTLDFVGTLENSSATISVPLSYCSGNELTGFNLVGNPFVHNVTSYASENVAEDCYRMNEAQNEIIVSDISEANPLKPVEGFFVKATGEGASITFNSQTRGEASHNGSIRLEVMENGQLLDRLIVKKEGEPLEKLSLTKDRTKLFATHGQREMAVVPMEGNEQSISFKAAHDGTYTLIVDVDGVEMEYLHLVDMLTGEDIDLLDDAALRQAQGPLGPASYTFEAKTIDTTDRFRLLFR